MIYIFWMGRIQPIAETREKQLKLWKELILKYCLHHKMYQLNPKTFPYFKNAAIDRELSPEAIETVANYLITQGLLQLSPYITELIHSLSCSMDRSCRMG